MNIKLKQNIDYYLNANGDMVFTEAYLLKRGHCCQSGCLHCPYMKKIDPHVPSEFQNSWSEPEAYEGQDEEEEYP